jgi:hypothetical protein
MILLYAHTDSSRLQYISRFVFRDFFRLSLHVSTDRERFEQFPGPKIYYGNEPDGIQSSSAFFHIPAAGLLEETGIRPISISVQPWRAANRPLETYNCFFHVPESKGYAFDVLSAAFYCLSRYEEYLPYTPDLYDRYPHTDSLAFRHGFLHQPLVNYWLSDLAEQLQAMFPGFIVQLPAFRWVPTYDIDMAWSYRHKGWLRNIGGMLRHPSFERFQVLLGSRLDPFDCFDWLDGLHAAHQVHPIYFFLAAAKRGRYDKNIPPQQPAMRQLIRHHARRYHLGWHPSWQHFNNQAAWQTEKAGLETAAGQIIRQSRQHYIHLQLPETYRQLQALGITDDYSMGYGSINGFRASVAHPFVWYDLLQETSTDLILHPFAFMDANSHYEQRQSVDVSYDELLHYFHQCQAYHGTLMTIFHNPFLGSDPQFAGWRDLYQRFIAQVPR